MGPKSDRIPWDNSVAKYSPLKYSKINLKVTSIISRKKNFQKPSDIMYLCDKQRTKRIIGSRKLIYAYSALLSGDPPNFSVELFISCWHLSTVKSFLSWFIRTMATVSRSQLIRDVRKSCLVHHSVNSPSERKQCTNVIETHKRKREWLAHRTGSWELLHISSPFSVFIPLFSSSSSFFPSPQWIFHGNNPPRVSMTQRGISPSRHTYTHTD